MGPGTEEPPAAIENERDRAIGVIESRATFLERM